MSVEIDEVWEAACAALEIDATELIMKGARQILEHDHPADMISLDDMRVMAHATMLLLIVAALSDNFPNEQSEEKVAACLDAAAELQKIVIGLAVGKKLIPDPR
jgi:hypothetical protein